MSPRTANEQVLMQSLNVIQATMIKNMSSKMKDMSGEELKEQVAKAEKKMLRKINNVKKAINKMINNNLSPVKCKKTTVKKDHPLEQEPQI